MALDKKFIVGRVQTYLRPLAEYMLDPSVTEIMVNPGGHVFVERAGIMEYHAQLLQENDIKALIGSLASYGNKNAEPGELSSIVNVSLGDLRISGALSPVSPAGSFFTVRKHLDKENRPTLEKLISWGYLTKSQADLLIKLVIHDKLNCLISGNTGAGKTTLLNAILQHLDRSERLVTIEDAPELHIPVPNWVPLQTNAEKDITAREMVKLCLRLRPDRLILGETRGDETFDLVRALNSGHPGSLTTIHGDSAEESLNAMENLYQMSVPKGSTISSELARGYISKSVKLVVFAHRGIEVENGISKVVRQVKEICLVKGIANGTYVLESLI